eukprot:8441412-Pyramimonas_sp.AAC.1
MPEAPSLPPGPGILQLAIRFWACMMAAASVHDNPVGYVCIMFVPPSTERCATVPNRQAKRVSVIGATVQYI